MNEVLQFRFRWHWDFPDYHSTKIYIEKYLTMLNMCQRKLYSPCVATTQLPGVDKDPTKYD